MFARASALLALAALAVVPQLGLVQAMVPLPPAGVAMSLPTCSRREDRRPLVPLGASTGMWTSSSFSSALAFQIPGDSIAETTILGGVLNFLSIYNLIITARVLLSWVPQLQGVALLEPVYVLTDPYLNAFRRLPLQFGGLDFSILPAFFLLNFAQSAVGALAAELPRVRSRKEEKAMRARTAALSAQHRP